MHPHHEKLLIQGHHGSNLDHCTCNVTMNHWESSDLVATSKRKSDHTPLHNHKFTTTLTHHYIDHPITQFPWSLWSSWFLECPPREGSYTTDVMPSRHNTKGGSNGHFNHVDPIKVNVYSVPMVCACYVGYFVMFTNFYQLDLHNKICVGLASLW